MLGIIERKRLLVPLPFPLARLQATFLQFLPNPPLTPDQVELLKSDNVVSEQAMREQRTLEGLGIKPTPMEAVLPSYLWRFRKTGQFSRRLRLTVISASDSATSPAPPTMIRHQANSAKLWRCT